MEFGCGGTIAKLSKENEIYCLPFTHCNKSELIAEAEKGANILGVSLLGNCLFPVRKFDEHRQAILDNMINVRDEYQLDMIFTPAKNDVHQDHHVITEEAMRAFKFSSIISYELPWNNFSFHTSYFVELSEENIQTKINAIKKYESQKDRSYASEGFIRSLATVRGTQINKQYAEAFEIIRMIQ